MFENTGWGRGLYADEIPRAGDGEGALNGVTPAGNDRESHAEYRAG